MYINTRSQSKSCKEQWIGISATLRKKYRNEFRNKGYIINKGGIEEIDQIRDYKEGGEKGLNNLDVNKQIKVNQVHLIIEGKRSNELILMVR